MTKGYTVGKTERALLSEKFRAILGELLTWRLDPYISNMAKGQGRVLPFVRGLRFSVRLMYIVREHLGNGLRADWGHLLDKDGNQCSKECDIIIHEPPAVARWNGNVTEPAMDFRFVKCSKAVVVISCKATVPPIDKEYVKEMRPFCDKVWLFSERCIAKSQQVVTKIRNDSHRTGYEHFWHLYRQSEDMGEPEYDEDDWLEFVAAVSKLRRPRKEKE